MLRRAGCIALIALTGVLSMGAASAAAAATPAAAGADPDVKCMLVASVVGRNADPKARGLSPLMTLYFLGRLDARKPGIDLAAALKATQAQMNQAELQVDGPKCVSMVTQRLQVLSQFGPPAAAAQPGAAAPAAPATPPASPPAPH